MKRSLARTLRFCLAALTLTGGALAYPTVGGAARPPVGRENASMTSTVVRVWYGTDDPTEEALAQALARRFEATHSGVRVDLQSYALADLNGRMELALSAGTPPDIVYTTPRGPGLAAYVRAGQLTNLSPAWRQRGWATRLRPNVLVDYNRLLTANSGVAGHVYAVPYTMAAVGVLYNKTLFHKLSLRIPRTLAELDSINSRVKHAGLTPIGLGNADGWVGDDWWLTMVNARTGPTPLAPALRPDPHFSFRGAPFRDAAVTLQRWATAGYFTPSFNGLDAQDSMDAFFDGRTAMQLISSTQNGQILALSREKKLSVGVFAFPSTRAGHPIMPQSGYAGWAIPRGSAHPALATAFIDQMLSPQTAALLLAHGLLPADTLKRDARTAAAFQQDFLQALETATPGVYLDAAPIPNLNATMEATIQLLLTGHESPDALLTQLQTAYASGGARTTSTRTDGEF